MSERLPSVTEPVAVSLAEAAYDDAAGFLTLPISPGGSPS